MDELSNYLNQMRQPENKILMLVTPVNYLYCQFVKIYGDKQPYLTKQQYITQMCEAFDLTTAYHYKTLYFETF